MPAISVSIKKRGDYFLFDVGEDSIILSKGSDNIIHGFHNVCRHRGARVAEQPLGNLKTFVCPYHSWVYNSDSSLKAARNMEIKEGFDASCYGLKMYRSISFKD
ncbi:MAG: phenylpropionate dioxygenase-like ring-hydroxylating dioxygenase large terminal subunit [Flavobacteriales bacterium]|jgi:Rieske 2Fe-2S family protein